MSATNPDIKSLSPTCCRRQTWFGDAGDKSRTHYIAFLVHNVNLRESSPQQPFLYSRSCAVPNPILADMSQWYQISRDKISGKTPPLIYVHNWSWHIRILSVKIKYAISVEQCNNLLSDRWKCYIIRSILFRSNTLMLHF